MSGARRPLLPTSRYAWLVGIAAVLVVGSIVIAVSRPAGPGAQGLAAGTQLPPFAVVRATSAVVCDSDDDPATRTSRPRAPETRARPAAALPARCAGRRSSTSAS